MRADPLVLVLPQAKWYSVGTDLFLLEPSMMEEMEHPNCVDLIWYLGTLQDAMEIGKTLFVTERSQWRAWLEKNFEQADEIWLIFPSQKSGKPRLIYNDAVEEALCFGWIDSIVKKFDDESAVHRFTQRNPASGYSQQNKERLRWLADHNLIHPEIRETILPVLEEKFIFPQDILDALKEHPIAWKNYQSYSPAYQRIRVAYIDSARNRPEEFQKRLANFILKCEQNKQIGYGGIDKYFL